MSCYPDPIQIEISAEKLASLIKDGHLCAANIRCLNPETKQYVWQLCLTNCANKLCQASEFTKSTTCCPTPNQLQSSKRII